MLRGLLGIVGVVVGLAWMAQPASAHGGAHAAIDRAGEATGSEDRRAAGDETGEPDDGLDDGPDDGPDDGHVGHEPNTHSHPIGEDDFHNKAAHCSLDFAHVHWPVAPPRTAVMHQRASIPSQFLSGITLTPPVPPPLA